MGDLADHPRHGLPPRIGKNSQFKFVLGCIVEILCKHLCPTADNRKSVIITNEARENGSRLFLLPENKVARR